MKYTGFISEIDDYAFAKSLKGYYLGTSLVNANRESIITYLKSGTLCVPFMGVAEDEDETVMGKISVLTDGEWFWPDYLASFIKKYPNFRIDPEFERHVLKNQGRKIQVEETAIAALEKEFLTKARFTQ
ncbi:MAG: hypothetical protein JNM88_04180 [Chitinophagaceae bacterium]|nr:hypothetical protein [Chitinophagaceae bacterium]